MNRRVKFLLLFLIAATTIALVTCKPIAYYLERVYKAYGTVIDAETRGPLESVEVFLRPYQYSVLTNGLGDYGIELAEGTWTLDFVKLGYVTVSKEVTVNAANPRVKVDDVELTLQPLPPPPPSEYFASFKFDGTPVKFTEGILEWGNVPLAAPETGWEHDGHVYDRTHIIAVQVGQPLELMSDNATQLGITLIGEPGTQPPPAGPYTFWDGFREIYNVKYSSPDFSYSVYDKGGNFGSASVTLTSVGGAGGFIEGTFSATVLEKGTFTPHYITEGAFHVKLP